MFAFEAYRVSVEVITDRWIKERLKRDGSADIFRIMRTRMYTLSMQESVKTLEQQARHFSPPPPHASRF